MSAFPEPPSECKLGAEEMLAMEPPLVPKAFSVFGVDYSLGQGSRLDDVKDTDLVLGLREQFAKAVGAYKQLVDRVAADPVSKEDVLLEVEQSFKDCHEIVAQLKKIHCVGELKKHLVSNSLNK